MPLSTGIDRGTGSDVDGGKGHTGLEVDVVVVLVDPVVEAPAKGAGASPLVPIVDDELKVSVPEPGTPPCDLPASSTIGWPEVDGTSTCMEAPGVRRATNTARVVATKVDTTRLQVGEVLDRKPSPRRAAARRACARDIRHQLKAG